jgi:hypothetical protein
MFDPVIQAAGMALAGFGIGMLAPNLFALAAGMGTEADRSRLFGFTKSAFFWRPAAVATRSGTVGPPCGRRDGDPGARIFRKLARPVEHRPSPGAAARPRELMHGERLDYR